MILNEPHAPKTAVKRGGKLLNDIHGTEIARVAAATARRRVVIEGSVLVWLSLPEGYRIKAGSRQESRLPLENRGVPRGEERRKETRKGDEEQNGTFLLVLKEPSTDTEVLVPPV